MKKKKKAENKTNKQNMPDTERTVSKMKRIPRALIVCLVTMFTHCRPSTEGVQVKEEITKDFC